MSKKALEEEFEAKKVKLTSIGETRGCGHVLTLGQGDTGQLGLGEDSDIQPGVMGEGGDSDQPQDMDTGTTEEEAANTQVVSLLKIV